MNYEHLSEFNLTTCLLVNALNTVCWDLPISASYFSNDVILSSYS